jgi:hypothetical protein
MSDPRRVRDCVKRISRQGLRMRAESTLLRVWEGGYFNLSSLRGGCSEKTIRRRTCRKVSSLRAFDFRLSRLVISWGGSQHRAEFRSFTSTLSLRHSFSIPIPCTGLFGSWVEGLLRPTPKSGTNFGCTQFTRYSLLLGLRWLSGTSAVDPFRSQTTKFPYIICPYFGPPFVTLSVKI